jgi:hypothetical protein
VSGLTSWPDTVKEQHAKTIAATTVRGMVLLAKLRKPPRTTRRLRFAKGSVVLPRAAGRSISQGLATTGSITTVALEDV